MIFGTSVERRYIFVDLSTTPHGRKKRKSINTENLMFFDFLIFLYYRILFGKVVFFQNAILFPAIKRISDDSRLQRMKIVFPLFASS